MKYYFHPGKVLSKSSRATDRTISEVFVPIRSAGAAARSILRHRDVTVTLWWGRGRGKARAHWLQRLSKYGTDASFIKCSERARAQYRVELLLVRTVCVRAGVFADFFFGVRRRSSEPAGAADHDHGRARHAAAPSAQLPADRICCRGAALQRPQLRHLPLPSVHGPGVRWQSTARSRTPGPCRRGPRTYPRRPQHPRHHRGRRTLLLRSFHSRRTPSHNRSVPSLFKC